MNMSQTHRRHTGTVCLGTTAYKYSLRGTQTQRDLWVSLLDTIRPYH